METARQSLAELVGERWRRVGRACDLVWLGFGPIREVTDQWGSARETSEYALHLQCGWRLCLGERRLTGSSDVYLPPSGWTGEGEFDWDVQGPNRFDVLAAKLRTSLEAEPVLVTSVEVTTAGSLTVHLSGGLRIEAPRGDSGSEDWRFFRPYRDEDHVVMPPES
ncbi:hypothetical protein [Lentzea kentuckyensis]|uniref:hypothetical protein n=1 Tax=Lentzea kentuckyensis TaxID=360086 RepID=UPI000A3837DC|nr:hypothetical protein [Lentzea kentuckyensis]